MDVGDDRILDGSCKTRIWSKCFSIYTICNAVYLMDLKTIKWYILILNCRIDSIQIWEHLLRSLISHPFNKRSFEKLLLPQSSELHFLQSCTSLAALLAQKKISGKDKSHKYKRRNSLRHSLQAFSIRTDFLAI